jgi:hypothetical protein
MSCLRQDVATDKVRKADQSRASGAPSPGEGRGSPKDVAQVSGHSVRVGATQDLLALNIDLAAITQAGGRKSTRMPLQYAEKINAARSGHGEGGREDGEGFTASRAGREKRNSNGAVASREPAGFPVA